MSNCTHRANILPATLVILLLAASASAQNKTLVDEDWYGDVKKALSDHYVGKTVKLKLPIPATRRGLELVDGEVQREVSITPIQFSAQIGDELKIKSFKVGDSNVEVLLGKDEPPPKRTIANLFAGPKQSRINLRFSHELSSKDMTIINLNRFLAQAVEVGTLAPPVAEDHSASSAGLNKETESQLNGNPEMAGVEPPLKIVGDLPAAGPDVGEVTIESSAGAARIYIDGAYSGAAPRTLRLHAGFHTILVVSDTYKTWERRLMIPGAKISVVRAELQK